MKRGLFLSVLLTGIIVVVGNSIVVAQEDMKPPVAKKETKITKINGFELKDDYFWLRSRKDAKGKVRKDVEDYLIAENRYTETVMKPTEAFQKTLYDEMLGRIKQTDLSVPYQYGKYWYYTKTQEGKQYPVYVRALDAKGKAEEVLLDQNELAQGLAYYAIGAFAVSDDGNLLAFSSDNTGYRQYKLQIKDLRTGKMLPDAIERVTSVVWANDNKHLFLVTEDEVTKRSDKFWRHEIGKNENALLFDEKDVLFNIGVGRSRDKKMIFLGSEAKTMREFYYLPADQPLGAFKSILPRTENHEYSADYYDGNFYIITNKDAANFRIVTAPVKNPSEKNWKDFLPANPKIKYEDINFFKDYAVIYEWENGLEHLRVINMRTRESHRIKTPESVYTIGTGTNREFDTDKIRYTYASMITPNSTFEYNMKTKRSKLLKQQEVLGGYDKTQYDTKRIWATARDGVQIPVSLVWKRGTRIDDGSAPMLLYAYGSYGFSTAPNFNSNRLSLLNRGMIFAIAHIRGGSEMGEQWRQEGRMFKKLNTFYDFVDSAEWLVKNKFTSSNRLVINGGSAGGLLMGAVVNLRPDLFKAVVAQVPFVDVMNTMLDETLPLTTEEWIEWGNPNEKAAFDYMIKYSPYDNITAKNYPNMLVLVSLNDSQVPYWEGAKFVAKLRATKTDSNTVLLKTNMGAGHGGASGRYDALKEQAFNYAYMLEQIGVMR
jgi:oligopeptidase B